MVVDRPIAVAFPATEPVFTEQVCATDIMRGGWAFVVSSLSSGARPSGFKSQLENRAAVWACTICLIPPCPSFCICGMMVTAPPEVYLEAAMGQHPAGSQPRV